MCADWATKGSNRGDFRWSKSGSKSTLFRLERVQSFFNVLFCGENPYTQGTRLIKTINRIYRLPATRFDRIRGHDVFVSLDLDLSRKHY